MAPLPFGSERGGGIALVKDDSIYIVGGVQSRALTTVQRYFPDEDRYESVEDLPEPRDHLVGGVIDNELVIAGGRERSINAHRPNVYIYNSSWREGAPMLTSRAGAAGAVLNNRLYVFGGEGNPNNDSGVFSQSESYDPRDDSWQAHVAMGVPRHGMGASTIDEVIYIAGGGDLIGLDATNAHESFTSGANPRP